MPVGRIDTGQRPLLLGFDRHAFLKVALTSSRKVASSNARTQAAYETGKATFAEVAEANALLLKAELELCESDKERLLVYEKALALAIECEKVAVQRYHAGQATHASVLAAKANRLEAEIAYERAKARVTPPDK